MKAINETRLAVCTFERVYGAKSPGLVFPGLNFVKQRVNQ